MKLQRNTFHRQVEREAGGKLKSRRQSLVTPHPLPSIGSSRHRALHETLSDQRVTHAPFASPLILSAFGLHSWR